MRPVKDTTPFEYKEMEFKVIKLDRKRNNVVVSRRAVLEETMGADREAMMENLKEAPSSRRGQEHHRLRRVRGSGRYRRLVHITDMAWRRVKHPSEVCTSVRNWKPRSCATTLQKNRVSLGIKQLGDDPGWASPPLPAGHPHVRQGREPDRLRRVRRNRGRHRRPGARLRNDWTNKNVSPSKIVQLGDEVEVMVLDIDEDKRRISLGMKQCKSNPWKTSR